PARSEHRSDGCARALGRLRGDRFRWRRLARRSAPAARREHRLGRRRSCDLRQEVHGRRSRGGRTRRSPRSRMTLARRIIPCLDVKDGRVVKGINFVALRDAGDPVEQAAAYDLQGADEVCFLDISASPEGRSTLVDVVARTADQVFVPLTVGGGVRTVEDAERLLLAGADKIAVNTAAIRTPQLVADIAARF